MLYMTSLVTHSLGLGHVGHGSQNVTHCQLWVDSMCWVVRLSSSGCVVFDAVERRRIVISGGSCLIPRLHASTTTTHWRSRPPGIDLSTVISFLLPNSRSPLSLSLSFSLFWFATFTDHLLYHETLFCVSSLYKTLGHF